MSRTICEMATVAMAGLLMTSGAALAQDVSPTITELIGASRFVVQSRVSKVDYRMSLPNANGKPGIPYTTVSYDVVRTVRGTPGTSSFSLRYPGGPDGQGHFLEASNVPVFQVGDEDILFVQGNGSGACPLAGCLDGRFRILNGAVYSGDGAPVQALSDGKVVARGAAPIALRTFKFPAPAFDDLIKNPEVRESLRQRGLSVDEARRLYKTQSPSSIEMVTISATDTSRDAGPRGARAAAVAGESAQKLAAVPPMTVDGFLASLPDINTAASQRATVFQGAVPGAQVAAPSPQPAAPAAQAANKLAAPQRSAADIAEERSLPKDDPSVVRRKSP